MQRLVFVRVVGLLEHRHIVGAALVKIAVLIGIDRIDLQPHIPEIFPRQLTGLADILHIALGPALPGQNQDLLHALSAMIFISCSICSMDSFIRWVCAL